MVFSLFMNTFSQCSLSAGLFMFGEPEIDLIHCGVRKLTNGNVTVLTGVRAVIAKGGQCLFGS